MNNLFQNTLDNLLLTEALFIDIWYHTFASGYLQSKYD